MEDEINGGAEQAPAETPVAPAPETSTAPAEPGGKGRTLSQMLDDSLRELYEREKLIDEVGEHEKAAKEAKAEKRAAAKAEKEAEAEPEGQPAKEQKATKDETPEDEPEEQTERDERGRFKAKNEADTEPAQEPEEAEPEEDAGPAPQRFTEAGKKAWARAPKEVRAEVERAISELEGGIQGYQEQLAGLSDENKQFMKANSLRFGDVLERAMQWDKLFSDNPIAGMEAMARQKGYSLHDIAANIVGQAPNADLAQMERAMAEVRNENASLKAKVQQYERTQAEQQTATVNQTISEFFSKHPEAEALSQHIARVIQGGLAEDLPTAYRLAQRLYADEAPAVQTTPAAEQPAPPASRTRDPKAQTQKASLSVSGTPLSGSNPGSRRPAPASVQDALTETMRDHGINL